MQKLLLPPAIIYSDLERIRSQAPLIHNVTNFVVMQQTANALLALGASKHKKIPIILDPVGVGASKLRTETARKLMQLGPAIIRGNASEILALYADGHASKGVDSLQQADSAVTAAREIAKQCQCTVIISGATDFIIDANQQLQIHNGTPMMTRVTGMGCTATAFIAAFCAINSNFFQAAAAAMAVMGIVGEIAAGHASGPGSLQSNFNDVVYQLTLKDITEKLRVSNE